MSAVSEEAKARARQYQRDRYRWYVDHGICARCYKTWAEPGRVYCANCKKKIAAHAKQTDPDGSKNRARCQARRDRLRDAGLCINCGKRKAVQGNCLCVKCADKCAESAVKYRIHQQTLNGESTCR